MSSEPCPLCGKPIQDTAYVCFDCQTWLAGRLRHAAGLWEHVQDTVGHLTKVEGVNPRRTDRRDVIGPMCERRACDHESCTAIWKTWSRGRAESSLAHEEKGLIDLDAFENAWIVENTANAWSSVVAFHRGNYPRVATRPNADTVVVVDARITRCLYSDLPIDQCSCGHQHQEAS